MEWKDKNVTVFYNDDESVKRKDGKLLDISDSLITLQEKRTGTIIWIPQFRLVRMELDKNG